RSAIGGDFAPFEAALGFTREFRGSCFSGFAVEEQDLRAQRRSWECIEKDSRARDTLEFISASNQMKQPLVVPAAPGRDYGVALQPARGSASSSDPIKHQAIMASACRSDGYH